MTAKFKSRVMQREEKVFGSVDMNRMMVAGLWTGFVYALLRLLQVGILMIPGVIAAFIFFLWLTGKPRGVPRYLMFFYGWRARLLITARRHPDSLTARLIGLLGWDAGEVIVNGDLLYTSAAVEVLDGSLAGFEILDEAELGAGGFEIVTDEELFFVIDQTTNE